MGSATARNSTTPESLETQLCLLPPLGAGAQAQLEITLSFPPTVNHIWFQNVMLPRGEDMQARVASHGWDGQRGDGKSFWKWLRSHTRVSRVTTPEAKAWRDEAAWRLKATRVHFETAPIAVWLVLHPKNRRQVDSDNFVKAVFDAMQACLMIENDAQVKDFRVTMGTIVPDGSVEVRAWRIA